MAAVPQKTLTWLYRVLTNTDQGPNQTYLDPNRTYNDVASLLAQHAGFAPRTDVYTYESGTSALLLQISGTLPVTFRGAVYRFPIAIWVPKAYPREPPMVYVTPTQEMRVRPGQHVSGEGRVYHHYLAHWGGAWERSTIVDFLYILRDVFAKEPPVISKQQQNVRPMPPQQRATPPAVPPLPPELAPTSTSTPSPVPAQRIQTPPRLPPKPGQVPEPQPQQRDPSAERRYNQPPPLPPLPADIRGQGGVSQQRPYEQIPNNRDSQHMPQRSSSLRQFTPATQPPLQPLLPPKQGYQQNGYQQPSYQGPVSPLPPDGALTSPQISQAQPYPPQPYPQGSYAQQRMIPHLQPRPHSVHTPYGPTPVPYPPHQPQQLPPAKKPEIDLLSADLEPDPQPIAPPIPPNPEKDALLRTLSKALTETLHSNIAETNSRLQPLHSQSQALHAAIATLQSEISALNSFQSTLQSNTAILQQSLHRADAVIADAKSRLSSPAAQPPNTTARDTSTTTTATNGLPAIDDVLVAPTVVGKQMYDLVADEHGIQRAIYALQAGLVKGRVGVDTWAKVTRGLAREAFLKRALVRKAGRGMGLVVD
ncbi:hypothetical protein FQN53_006180 [Emmonsiellopsis sp. PD_33]|nr:hypothetical protein FQN53_006180 [Emmonsiellopsis sp. PD_33]